MSFHKTKKSANKKSPYQLHHRMNPRADAAWVLYQILEHGKSSREVMPKVFARYERDTQNGDSSTKSGGNSKAWLQEMVFGCLRELPKLQFWLRQLLDKPLKGDHKVIEHLIMLGFYQLTFSRTSEHAAVSETVEACAVLGHHRLKGLVNANLRTFQRNEIADQAIDQAHVNLGLPKWLYKQLLQQYPNDVEQIAANMSERPPLWLRVNALKANREDYVAQLTQAGIEFTEAETQTAPLKSIGVRASQALQLTKRGDITQLPGFEAGEFAVQDLAAQLAAELLDVQSGDAVLDCCAAPGGKTAHILESQSELAKLDAIDSDGERLERIDENMLRLGHKDRFGERLNLYVVDASDTDILDRVLGSGSYDRILLDAPCSATGVIRRHPDIRWLRKAADIENTVALQERILDAIWMKLKPGGTLVYATCSILQQENAQQIARFLSVTPDAELQPLHSKDTTEQPGLQILPGQAYMDGFYYAKLCKRL
jgi:16S rRNA (cytosine967-C5)-methyltransferase